jgi:hypothetical protein
MLDGIVEQLKRQRDLDQAFIDLFTRRDRLIMNEIDPIHRRITSNQSKLNSLRLRSGGAGNPTVDREMDRLEQSILQDQRYVELNSRRNEMMRLSLWQEFRWVHENKAFVSLNYSQYALTMMSFAEKVPGCKCD